MRCMWWQRYTLKWDVCKKITIHRKTTKGGIQHEKTKGRMRGILSLVLAMLLMVTMIPAQKVLAEGEPAGNPTGSTGNLTFASFDSTDISLGEVQWKNGDADTWHTQTTTGM